uniref:Uncharacterized protein LOC114326528 n=1 Tax=Diabrotica virgifera virgifera TaxID=50390 RepID=A0A6P7F4W4_DIAVI
MKQDIFNLVSIFMGNHEETVKVQIQDTSKEEIVKEMADLKMTINQMAHKIEKLGTNEKPNKTPPQTIKKSISTQTDPTETQEPLVSSPSKVNTVPPTKYTVKENWHYVVVSKIPPPYTAKQIAHYVKEKLGTTDFIRCFPLLRDTDRPDSDFKIGVQNQSFIKLLKDPSLWPPGTVVDNLNDNPPAHANSASTTIKVAAPASSTPYTTPSTPTKEGISIQIGSDRDAIIASKSFNKQNSSIVVTEKTMKKDDGLCMDPMTPPIVRLSRTADVENSRYLLARLRDPGILNPLRLFLAYLHDQPPSTCYDGHTNTTIKLMLASEGLPTDVDSLRKLYHRVHEAYGISTAEVEADLSDFGTFFSTETRLRLQKIRECQNKYFSSNSPSSKNFF